MKENRLEFLDSLRGVAAIFVVLSHFLKAYALATGPQFNFINFSPLSFFYDGFAAVALFFVLSGYVLTLSLEKAASLDLLTFFRKRIFRIWPAYALVFFISLALSTIYVIQQTTPMTSSWLNYFWSKPLNYATFFKQLIFIGDDKDLLIPQGWSLRVEMQFSLLLPFLYIIYKKGSWLALLLVNLVLYFVFSGSYFIFHFSLGIYLAMEQKAIIEYFAVIKNKYKLLFICLIIALYTYRNTLPVYYYNYFNKDMFGSLGDGSIWLINGIGAFLLLIYCLQSATLQKVLNTRILLFLGKISYSIYLTHLLIQIVVVPLFIKQLNLAGIYNKYVVLSAALIILLLVTIVVSYLLWKFVERPFSKIGHAYFSLKKQQISTT